MLYVFRTDSSRAMGSGHLMRCLTLADELAGRGHEVAFICRELPGHLSSLVRSRGHDVRLLAQPPEALASGAEPPGGLHASWLGVSQDVDAAQTVAVLEVIGSVVDWVVVDHYALDERWERTIRPWCRNLLVIDDLADRRHDCRLLVDQNLHALGACRYENLVSKHCRVLAGPEYALLRSEFARARPSAAARNGVVGRILVFFGGVDATNQTAIALEAIFRLPEPKPAVDVIVGQANPHLEALQALSRDHPEITVHLQTHRVAELMASADLAIGSGGVALWERCAMGLPALVWVTADNQREQVAAVAELGAVYCVGESVDNMPTADTVAAHLAALRATPHLCRSIGRRAASLCDGRGVRRISDRIAPPRVTLRPARPDDCRNVHMWRNDPRIRAVSVEQQHLPYEIHEAWFRQVLAAPSRHLLIAEFAGEPVGVIRYDVESDIATVSLYVSPENGGKGLGSAMLSAGEQWLRQQAKEVCRVRALVLDTNAPSKALFEAQGFSRHQIVYEKEVSSEV